MTMAVDVSTKPMPGEYTTGMPLLATTGDPSAGVVAAVGEHGDGPPRADAGHGLDHVVRASVRHEQHGERPAPRGHLTLRDEDTAVVPPRPGRLAAPTGRIPFSDPHPTQDRGRAPPVLSGT